MKEFLINLKYAFNPNKPRLTIRLVINYILVKIFKVRLLRYLDISLGSKCNLKCKHCFSANEPQETVIKPIHFQKIAQEAMDLGCVNFSFQGGEPLLYDIEEYIKACKPYKNLISISTNGHLLTEEKCKKLKKIGVDILTISYDRFRENADIVMKIKIARQAGLKVTIASTITREDLDSPLLASLLLFSEMWKIICVLILPVPIGKLQGDKKILFTTEDMNKLNNLCKKYKYTRTDLSANYCEYGCGAGKEILFISPTGETYPCPFLPESFGNALIAPLKEIRKNMMEVPALDKYIKKCIAGEKGGYYDV